MKGLLTAFVLTGVMVMFILFLNGEMNPAGIELMQNTAAAEPIVP